MMRSRNVDHLRSEVFAGLRVQPLDRVQRTTVDEIRLAAVALAEMPDEIRRASIAALIAVVDEYRPPRSEVYWIE